MATEIVLFINTLTYFILDSTHLPLRLTRLSVLEPTFLVSCAPTVLLYHIPLHTLL
jgi:hypothetical protein